MNATKNFRRIAAIVITVVMLVVLALPATWNADAVSVDYAAQLICIATADNSKTLDIAAVSDKSAVITSATDGSQNENWQLRYTGTDSRGSYYKIVNMGSGRLLTPMGYTAVSGTKAVIFGDESDKSQHWYITAVSQDSYGTDLYYKITNYNDPDMALTYNQADNTVTLASYTGATSQQWLLNTSGVQGFAGYVTDNNGNPKASVIGGALGETVEVTTFDELKAACEDNDPKTIVITANISKTGTYTTDGNGRYQFKDARIYIRPNKTIIGSYSAHSLYNVYFCTYDRADYGLGNNIIIRNIEISHDSELNNDNVWDFANGDNFWIDHCTFIGHSAVNTASTGLVDWDKFLCFYREANYVTISDCSFGLHEYGILLGYPDDTDELLATYNNFPFVTLADNHFNNTLTRAPGLIRYGYYHSLNNFVENFNLGYTIHTASKLYAEANYYDGGTGKGSVVNDDATNITSISSSNIANAIPYYTDVNSVAVNCYNNNNLDNIKSNKLTSWKPSDNYSYTAMTAEEAKAWTTAHAGAQSSASAMTYAVYDSEGVPSAGYTSKPDIAMDEPVTTEPVTEPVLLDGAEVPENTLFMLKNQSSGLYMDVEGGTAASGTNVQQWGASSSGSQNTWKFVSGGDGYYYIYSQVGDGQTYLLDVSYGKSDNGTNIGIYSNTNADAQLFKFVKNDDGSYRIVTKVSSDTSCVEVINASNDSGANVQEWELNGASCQNWILEEVKQTTLVGDTNFDGVVDVFDMSLLRSALKTGATASSKLIAASDINGDGTVNVSDAVALQNYLLGRTTSFKAGVYAEY
jgi:pectin lyase